MMNAALRVAAAFALFGGLVATPGAAADGWPLTLLHVVDVLTLGVESGWDALVDLGVRSRFSALETGENELYRDALREPLTLLELSEIPPEIIGRAAVDRIGPIIGSRATDVPTDVALAAIALGGPVSADSLRSTQTRASIRNEDAELQREDLAALLGRQR